MKTTAISHTWWSVGRRDQKLTHLCPSFFHILGVSQGEMAGQWFTVFCSWSFTEPPHGIGPEKEAQICFTGLRTEPRLNRREAVFIPWLSYTLTSRRPQHWTYKGSRHEDTFSHHQSLRTTKASQASCLPRLLPPSHPTPSLPDSLQSGT